jgi:hypothetical protein
MHYFTLHRESGKRDSNPRPQPWQGCALPTELFPQTTQTSRTATESAPAPTLASPAAAAVLGKFRGNGGEGNRTPDLLNAIQALSQLSYAPRDGRVRCEEGLPSGTAKYSRVYIACQRNGTSENICGQYFAAPSGVVADLGTDRRSLAISRLLTIGDATSMQRNRRRS